MWDCGEQNGIGEGFSATISVLWVIIVSLLLNRPTCHESTYKRIFPVLGGFCLKEVIVCSVNDSCLCTMSGLAVPLHIHGLLTAEGGLCRICDEKMILKGFLSLAN